MKIACIILTYNRLLLLQRCVKYVLKQSYKSFDIFIIDNASSDGTATWLENQKCVNVIRIEKNEGAANGFFVGIQAICYKGYDWIWIMDDDGVPDKNQLQELVTYTKKHGLLFTNALVCDIDDPQFLSFKIKGKERINEVKKEEVILGVIHPYNGTFIHRTVVERIGNVKKEMYLYGCETEYQYRAMKYGLQVATVTSARHYHPRAKGVYKNILPFCFRYRLLLVPPKTSASYYRNMGYIQREYSLFTGLRGKLMVIAYMIYFFRTFQFGELKKFIRCYQLGRKSHWEE